VMIEIEASNFDSKVGDYVDLEFKAEKLKWVIILQSFLMY
jgi:hypothetical protein